MNTNLQLQFQKLLSKNNYRCTEERRVLFSTLKNQSNPCTIQELVTATSGSLDPATVYRNVELFEKLNVVHRVYTGWKYKVELSDDFRDHHHHMTCTNCSTITSFE
jgi:Fe2+ or Zn2+ uptake regulation protein